MSGFWLAMRPFCRRRNGAWKPSWKRPASSCSHLTMQRFAGDGAIGDCGLIAERLRARETSDPCWKRMRRPIGIRRLMAGQSVTDMEPANNLHLLEGCYPVEMAAEGPFVWTPSRFE